MHASSNLHQNACTHHSLPLAWFCNGCLHLPCLTLHNFHDHTTWFCWSWSVLYGHTLSKSIIKRHYQKQLATIDHVSGSVMILTLWLMDVDAPICMLRRTPACINGEKCKAQAPKARNYWICLARGIIFFFLLLLLLWHTTVYLQGALSTWIMLPAHLADFFLKKKTSSRHSENER